MAGMSTGVSSGHFLSDTRQSNITNEMLAALRTSALQNLETSVMTDIGDRRSTAMDLAEDSYLPNLSFADQLQSARKTLSIGADDTDASYIRDDMTADFTRTHFHLLLDDDPGWKATEVLFCDFLRFLLLFPGQHQVFDLVNHFEELCSDQVKILHKVVERGVPGKQKFTRTVEMLRYMEGELWTWRLIRMLYSDRLSEKAMQHVEETSEKIRSMTDSQKWQYLYDTDSNFRELRLAVKWCELNAADLLDSGDTVNLIGEKWFLWEDSLHYLKAGKGSSRKHVRQMDPDAPIRENIRLHDSDEAEEQRLLTLIFLYVRAGRLEEAVDMCVRSGSAWRAATLKGAIPYNRELETGETVGNAARDIWKRMAWQFCDHHALPSMERAIYGALSGHIASVLPSCGSWDDVLWAYAIGASEQAFHEFLKQTTGKGKRKIADLPQISLDQQDGAVKLEEILKDLAASDDEKIWEESKSIFRRIQSLIFVDKPDEAVAYMHQYLTDNADTIPKHMVRLMAHVVLVFKRFAFEIPDRFANGILEHYVSMLIDDQQKDLVAFYAATLPETLQIMWYAKFLENIEGREKRAFYLSLADKAGLDVTPICVAVVNNIRQAFEPSIEADQSMSFGLGDDDAVGEHTTLVKTAMVADVPERDLRLVNAVEWLLLDPTLHGEAVIQANAIGRVLLIGHNLSAAKKLFDSLPSDVISSASDVWLNFGGATADMDNRQLSLGHQNVIREFLCHLAYLEAHDTFLRWFQHYHRKKPKLEAPTTKGRGASGAAVFHERAVVEMRRKQFEEDTKVWKQEMKTLADAAVESCMGVLLYPDGGWMVDLSSNTVEPGDNVADPERKHELVLLRKQCIPLITDMLITVFHGSERFKEASRVADIIASEETCLYQVFTRDQLKHVVRRLADASIDAMDHGLTCLGYE